MKSEWEFQFEARGFRFEREHKYKISPAKDQPNDWPPDQADCLVRIVPNDETPPSGVEQVGSMFVTLRHSKEETRALALHVAAVLADRVTFHQGDFRVFSSIVWHTRIAETPEEEREFGDRIHSVQFSLEELTDIPTFDSKRVLRIPETPRHVELISQYNETKRDKSPIRQFLGYFRILESIYHAGREKTPLKKVLVESQQLRQIHQEFADDDAFESIIEELVEIRHRCAHLKLTQGFGFVPADPAVMEQVAPRIGTLARLAYRSITGPSENPNSVTD